MVKHYGGEAVSHLTLIQCHFVRDKLNHRIRYGSPQTTVVLDKYRKLACFEAGATLGYIRWRANEYGTQDWRFFVLKTQSTGLLTRVPGVTPAVKVLAAFTGTQAVKRALAAIDDVEKSVSQPIETLSEGYWIAFQNDLSSRRTVTGLRPDASFLEAQNVI